MTENTDVGVIYIAINEAMPGYSKIGSSSRDDNIGNKGNRDV